ncbi:hypothetical protein B484DRAFT_454214 [Ochromonadaceae sp. CCMP2298]|nr:hypothetical protein B484DRAFT_454214 [Ochromonadaceae sp. CCMP2298]|mmetsp:Transcript_10195/g.22618  ORF Transcript_10195/g.22618 Transcript_10195/m.22618 type:complete len:211 (+) Transcript_10195:92-724(+)
MAESINKAIIHLCFTRGFMPDRELQEHIQTLRGDFDKRSCDRPLADIFRSMNADLRSFAFEVKSVRIMDDNNEPEMYHGIVNIEEDITAKEHGSPLDAAEVKYFGRIARQLLETNSQSSGELTEPELREKMEMSKAKALLVRLEEMGWLRRNDNNYIILGVRAHLELHASFKAMIREYIQSIEEGDDQDRAGKVSTLTGVLDELPQQIVY